MYDNKYRICGVVVGFEDYMKTQSIIIKDKIQSVQNFESCPVIKLSQKTRASVEFAKIQPGDTVAILFELKGCVSKKSSKRYNSLICMDIDVFRNGKWFFHDGK